MKRFTARWKLSIFLVVIVLLVSFYYLVLNGTVVIVATGTQDIKAMHADTSTGSKNLLHVSDRLAIGAYFNRNDRSIQVGGVVGGVDRRADFGYATPGELQIARVHFKADGSFESHSTRLP
jgi:hypothetical protein